MRIVAQCLLQILIFIFVVVPVALGQPKQKTFTSEEIKKMSETKAIIETKFGNVELKFFPEVAPNHVNNFCSAPIIADTQVGKILYQSSYYYIGHFSRFIRPGARRVVCAKTLDAIESTAFVNTDGTVVMVVMNRSEKPIEFFLKVQELQAKTSIPAHGIKTYLFEEQQ